MAQTGETKLVITAGVPSVGNTGETKFTITAGIPSAYTDEEPPVGDPEANLIGGKLVNGGLLQGRLV